MVKNKLTNAAASALKFSGIPASLTSSSSPTKSQLLLPPLRIPLLFLDGGSLPLTILPDASLEQLMQCAHDEVSHFYSHSDYGTIKEKTSKSHNKNSMALRLCIEEGPSRGGALSALKTAASHLTSWERLLSLSKQWANYLLLPEAVGKEVMGRGAFQWLKDNIWLYVGGTAEEVAAMTAKIPVNVHLYSGQRVIVPVNSRLNIHQIKVAVNAHTGAGVDSQRLTVQQVHPPSWIESVVLSIVRLWLLIVVCGVVAFVGPVIKAVKKQKDKMDHVYIRVNTKGGEGEVVVRVRRDCSLAELEREVGREYGEVLTLEGLCISGMCSSR